MSVESLNQQISYVSQEQFLFNISLLENIRLGKPEASDEEVMAAAQKAQCGEFLSRLPEGIHTMAGDGWKTAFRRGAAADFPSPGHLKGRSHRGPG